MHRTLPIVAALLLLGCSKSTPQPEQPTEKPLACDAAEPRTCDVEGMRWENGMGRSRSKNEAARYYAAACDADYAPGCAHLGALYFESEDTAQARALYEKACVAGEAEACGNLAFLESKAGNVEEARAMYQSACDDGAMFACANLADMYQSGRTGAVDHDSANALFEKACYGGNASACIRWTWQLAQDCGGDDCSSPAETEKEAAGRTAERCEADGDATICTGYAVHLESGRLLKKNPEKARALYEEGCASSHPWACERLGTAMVRGLGGMRDAAGAAARYREACDAGFAAGCSGLAALHLNGDGVERDEQAAGKYLGLACELNSSSACNTLLLFGLEPE